MFTDVVGSTRLLREMGADAYAAALERHRLAIREAGTSSEGVEVDTQGDSFFFAFPTAHAALRAAEHASAKLASGPLHIRCGMHSGTALVTGEGYVGLDVHIAARLAAAGHADQVLASGTTAALIGFDRFQNLGSHRFRDVPEALQVYQLGDRTFPPIASLHRTNVPESPTRLIGREAELNEIAESLRRSETRLLTLTGTGGVGKTRLATAAAAAVIDAYPDGVWWVPLASVRAPEDAPGATLQAIDGSLNTVQALAGRRMLLVLDNAEHLLPAIASFAADLLLAAGPTVLVTSRERLAIAGEQVWPVPEMAEADGFSLFVARAKQLDPTYTADSLVPELCRRLEHLPLALELAAAQTPAFSTEQLLDNIGTRLDLRHELRDAEPRQRTLRETIGWSYRLLSTDEQRLLRRLSVFVGGFTADAAERICEATTRDLRSFVDKSLVRRTRSGGTARFLMLELVREFATEQASDVETEEVAERHAVHFAAMTERMWEGVERPEPAAVDAEVPNLQAALRWASERHRADLVITLITGASYVWDRGPVQIVKAALEDALQVDVPIGLRARALNHLAWELHRTGDRRTGMETVERAEELAGTTGDPLLAAKTANMRAGLLAAAGEYEEAYSCVHRALDLYRRAGHGLGIANTLTNLGDLALLEEDFERAAAMSRQAVAQYDASGETSASLTARLNLAAALARLGRVAEAEAYVSEGLREIKFLDDGYSAPWALQIAADLREQADDPVTASRLVGAADALMDALGAVHEPSSQRHHDALMHRLDGGDAYEAGRKMSLEDAMSLALGDDRNGRQQPSP